MKKKNVYFLMLLMVLISAVLFLIISLVGVKAPTSTVTVAGEGNFVPNFRRVISGGNDHALKKPMDVFVTGNKVYVSDTENHQIQVFSTDGKWLSKFGEKGTSEGQFSFPYGVTADKDGNIYVADMANNNISIFNPNGKFLKYFKPEGDVKIVSPAAIRIFDNKLYVPEVNDDSVSVFDLAGKRLLYIKNKSSDDFTSISSPNAVAIDSKKNIYVADTGHSRIAIFDDKGKFKKNVNGKKDANSTESIIGSPRGLFVDTVGNIYVIDKIAHEVFVFDKNGKKVSYFGEMGSDVGQFYYPNGIFQTQNGDIYITDLANRVQVFN